MVLDADVAQLASVDKLAVSARDTKVPEDQVVYVGCEPVQWMKETKGQE